jgi:hypothetical protein
MPSHTNSFTVVDMSADKKKKRKKQRRRKSKNSLPTTAEYDTDDTYAVGGDTSGTLIAVSCRESGLSEGRGSSGPGADIRGYPIYAATVPPESFFSPLTPDPFPLFTQELHRRLARTRTRPPTAW